MTYNIGTVSPSAIACMVFSLIVAFALPVALFIVAKRKLGAKTSAAVTGASVFAVFVLGLESALSLLLAKLGVLERSWQTHIPPRFTAGLSRRCSRSSGGFSP